MRNSRIESVRCGPGLGYRKLVLLEKGKTKKLRDNKKENKEKRKAIQRINNNILNFNKKERR